MYYFQYSKKLTNKNEKRENDRPQRLCLKSQPRVIINDSRLLCMDDLIFTKIPDYPSIRHDACNKFFNNSQHCSGSFEALMIIIIPSHPFVICLSRVLKHQYHARKAFLIMLYDFPSFRCILPIFISLTLNLWTQYMFSSFYFIAPYFFTQNIHIHSLCFFLLWYYSIIHIYLYHVDSDHTKYNKNCSLITSSTC